MGAVLGYASIVLKTVYFLKNFTISSCSFQVRPNTVISSTVKIISSSVTPIKSLAASLILSSRIAGKSEVAVARSIKSAGVCDSIWEDDDKLVDEVTGP